MALNQVQFQGPVQSSGKSGKSGGGKWGQVAGALAGAAIGYAAAPATGGLSVAAMGAMGGAGSGAGLGSMIGEAVKPTQQSTAMSRRADGMQTPTIQHSDRSEQLKQSILALHTQPDDIKQQYAPTLVNAYMKSLSDDHAPQGVA